MTWLMTIKNVVHGKRIDSYIVYRSTDILYTSLEKEFSCLINFVS